MDQTPPAQVDAVRWSELLRRGADETAPSVAKGQAGRDGRKRSARGA